MDSFNVLFDPNRVRGRDVMQLLLDRLPQELDRRRLANAILGQYLHPQTLANFKGIIRDNRELSNWEAARMADCYDLYMFLMSENLLMARLIDQHNFLAGIGELSSAQVKRLYPSGLTLEMITNNHRYLFRVLVNARRLLQILSSWGPTVTRSIVQYPYMVTVILHEVTDPEQYIRRQLLAAASKDSESARLLLNL